MKYLSLFVCFGLFPGLLLAQSLERKVFSNGGGTGTAGTQIYHYTLGEPIIGTASSGALQLTKGFHQPLSIFVLAFQLQDFSAKAQETGVSLQWRSNLLMDHGIFEIERSDDGWNFEMVAQSNPTALADQLTSYHWEDPSVATVARRWYRITMLSFSGQVVQSEILEVGLPPSPVVWRCYPNPSPGPVWISGGFPVNQAVQFLVYNSLGQLVWQEAHTFPQATQAHSLDLSRLAGGAYQLVVQQPDQQWSGSLLIQQP